MVLRHGDTGEAVKTFQRGLNKLGSILLIDGDFGPGTRDAVIDARAALKQPGPAEADDALQAAVADSPELFPPLTAAGVTFIAREEVSSPALYRRIYARPTWPPGESGITIGIGYDLRFVDPIELRADWSDRLPADTLERLTGVLKRQGSPELLAQVRDVTIPLADAVAVFVRRSLPTHLGRARSIYPQVDDLAPARQTALASLVYNRGTSLEDDDSHRQSRREMRQIQALLAAGTPDPVADQLDAMTRLWDPATAPGLIERRHREATLWRSGFAALQLD
jgi:peptidoglycan hydrolase-like protein with peptidoglycan-binding domain